MSVLVGLDEIAQRLRKPPQVVTGWHYFTNELPPPDAVVDTEPVWEWDAIQAWDNERQRMKTIAAMSRAEAAPRPAVHYAPYPDRKENQ